MQQAALRAKDRPGVACDPVSMRDEAAPCEMEKALDHLQSAWSTAEQYLLAAGTAPQTLQAIRQALAD